MATEVFVPVVIIEDVRVHPNAEKLELATVLGYQIVIPKGKYKNGDKLIYFPPDTLLPAKWADLWNVRTYLKGANKERVGSINLRHQVSHGLLIDFPQDQNWEVGDNVAEFFGATKYEPPVRVTCGDAAPDDPLFPKYMDIKNLRHYPHVFNDGEMVSATEKTHGTNSRAGICDGIEKAGSMEIPRKLPCRYYLKKDIAPEIVSALGDCFDQLPELLDMTIKLNGDVRAKLHEAGIKRDELYDAVQCTLDDKMLELNTYWFPWTIPAVKNLLYGEYAKRNAKQVIIFGEVYGRAIQKKFNYGAIDKLGYRAFDLIIDGRYLGVDEFRQVCSDYGVEMMPEVYRGPYDIETIRKLAEGKTQIGGDHIKEGLVVKSLSDRVDSRLGRLCFKYVSDTFIANKDGADFKDV